MDILKLALALAAGVVAATQYIKRIFDHLAGTKLDFLNKIPVPAISLVLAAACVAVTNLRFIAWALINTTNPLITSLKIAVPGWLDFSLTSAVLAGGQAVIYKITNWLGIAGSSPDPTPAAK